MNENKQPSTTKRGPGRFHKSGHKKATPIPSMGAGSGFVVNTATPGNKMRRDGIKARGLRQFKREVYLKHDGYADRHPLIATRYAF